MYWTNHTEATILNTFLGITAVAPTQLYVAAMLSNPGETGTGTEISYSGYTRKAVSFSTPSLTSTGATIMNVADVEFDTSPISAGTISHFGLMDSLVGGNMWAYIALDQPITVNTGVAPLLLAQEWNYTTSGNFSNNFKTRILNLLRGTNIPGFTPHIALFSGNPDSGANELSGGNYERFSATFGTPTVQPAGQTSIINSVTARSNRADTSWGTWTTTAIMDSYSSGDVVAFGALSTPVIVTAGVAAMIKDGNLSVSVN